MHNQYRDPEYHKKYYQEHKAEIAARRKENYKKEKSKEYKRNYYLRHREEILAKQRARKAAKKATNSQEHVCEVKNPFADTEITLIYRALTSGFQEITKVLWWIAFAVSFVGVAVLFK